MRPATRWPNSATSSSACKRSPRSAVHGRVCATAISKRKKKPASTRCTRWSEDETICRLATGIKRFKLPDEFNFIKIFRQIVENAKGDQRAESYDTLAAIFANRRQYPQSAEWWRKAIKDVGPGNNNYREHQLQQIVGNWGRFEQIMTQPAGQGATVEFRFRNGKQVHFEAHAIDIEKLLTSVKDHLKTGPAFPDYQQINIQDIGFRLVVQNQQQFLGAQVAAWDLPLEPREQHFDRQVTVTTPLQQAGAYLLKATMADGNTSYVVMWLADTAIIKKGAARSLLLLCRRRSERAALAEDERRVFRLAAKAFGRQPMESRNGQLRSVHRRQRAGRWSIRQQQPAEYQWLAIARGDQGRLAYLGFSGLWYPRDANVYDAAYNQTKVLLITDRPVYRPKQTVQFKLWVRHAQYDKEDTSDFADQAFNVEIHNPKGEKILKKDFKTDAYGGMSGELELPADATLGMYQVVIPDKGGGSFRVEEYKKPEFEVLVDAPKEPIMLGDQITATIKARYYFGAPVTKAKVKYKVLRTNYDSTWYAPHRWDWMYGTGYWWLANDVSWYPGWQIWGCRRPISLVVGPCSAAARNRGRARSGNRRRRHPDGAHRHRARQGHSSRPGSSILDHGRSGRRIARARSWAPATCWWRDSRSACLPGSTAAIIESATWCERISPRKRSTKSRSPAKAIYGSCKSRIPRTKKPASPSRKKRCGRNGI